jgi:DNA-binding transcriptional MerR regulator
MVRGSQKKPKRRGYVRRSRARPKVGWSLRELARLTGISPRTLRLYLQKQVLPRAPFSGSATRYQRRHLLSLLAIRRLRTREGLDLAAIRTRLAALPAPELETFATEDIPQGPLAEALGLRPAPPPRNEPAPVMPRVPRWARLELALGLELHVRDDASGQVLELVRRVRELCDGASSGAVVNEQRSSAPEHASRG